MTPEQKTVAGLTMAALAQDHDGLAHLINNLPDDQVRDATAHAMTLLIAAFRPLFDDASWQALIDEGRSTLLLLELDPS